MYRNRIFIGALAAASVLLAACGPHQFGSEPILLFDGVGTSRGSVAALRAVLKANHLAYATVDSAQLNRMDETALRGYQLLIVPGGNFVEMGFGGGAVQAAVRMTDLRMEDPAMLSSFPVACQHEGCDWTGSLIP